MNSWRKIGDPVLRKQYCYYKHHRRYRQRHSPRLIFPAPLVSGVSFIVIGRRATSHCRNGEQICMQPKTDGVLLTHLNAYGTQF